MRVNGGPEFLVPLSTDAVEMGQQVSGITSPCARRAVPPCAHSLFAHLSSRAPPPLFGGISLAWEPSVTRLDCPGDNLSDGRTDLVVVLLFDKCTMAVSPIFPVVLIVTFAKCNGQSIPGYNYVNGATQFGDLLKPPPPPLPIAPVPFHGGKPQRQTMNPFTKAIAHFCLKVLKKEFTDEDEDVRRKN
ncbi:unnamed protein product, partial [Iphiclides podalirius]